MREKREEGKGRRGNGRKEKAEIKIKIDLSLVHTVGEMGIRKLLKGILVKFRF